MAPHDSTLVQDAPEEYRYDEHVKIDSEERGRVLRTGGQRGADAVYLGEVTKAQREAFHQENAWKLERLTVLTTVYEKSEGDCRARYHCDYGAWDYAPVRELLEAESEDGGEALEQAFQEPNYRFWCALLECETFREIVKPEKLLGDGLIVDVGCGVGQLLTRVREFLDVDNEDLFGLDISPSAIFGLKKAGFRGSAHTLTEACTGRVLSADSTRLLFLSYFVDRDDNQEGTFRYAAEVLKTGGRVVLEGLFPIVTEDSNGTQYNPHNLGRVAKGESASSDVAAICDFMDHLGLKLEHVSLGERLVFSLDKFEILPSTFLVFQKG